MDMLITLMQECKCYNEVSAWYILLCTKGGGSPNMSELDIFEVFILKGNQ